MLMVIHYEFSLMLHYNITLIHISLYIRYLEYGLVLRELA